jgi:hypothetical protein
MARNATSKRKKMPAPLPHRNAAHARNVQPRITPIGRNQRREVTHAYNHTTSAKTAGHSTRTTPNTVHSSWTLPTSRLKALPLCCTGATKDKPRGTDRFSCPANPASMVKVASASANAARPIRPPARCRRLNREVPARVAQRQAMTASAIKASAAIACAAACGAKRPLNNRASAANPEASDTPAAGVSEPRRNSSRCPVSGSTFHSASNTGASTIGTTAFTRVGVRERDASLNSSVCTVFGSARCGSGIRFAAPSFTGTTVAPFTVADHSSVPPGNVSRKCGCPRFFTK